MSATISATMACDTEQERLMSILSLLRQKTPVSLEVMAEFITLANDMSNLVGFDQGMLDAVVATFDVASCVLQRRERLASLMAIVPFDGNVDDVDEGADFLRLADDADLIGYLTLAERAVVAQKAAAVRKHIIHY